MQILPNAIIVDVSHWQPPGSIDWVAARAQGNVVGAIIKIMQGGSLDPAHVQHLRDAKAAGLLLGVYDFGTESPDQAAFLKVISAEFGGDAPLLVLDSEQNSSSQMTVSGMEEWSDGVASAEGRRPVLYMGRAGPDGTGRGLPSAKLSESDLWLPKYGPEPDISKLPPGFRLPSNDTERGGVLRLWQFTGDGINAPASWPAGIPPKCDLSYAVGFSSLAALTAWWRGDAMVSGSAGAPITVAPPPPSSGPPAVLDPPNAIDALLNAPDFIRAVKLFQASQGLTTDGVIGPRTLRALTLGG